MMKRFHWIGFSCRRFRSSFPVFYPQNDTPTIPRCSRGSNGLCFIVVPCIFVSQWTKVQCGRINITTTCFVDFERSRGPLLSKQRLERDAVYRSKEYNVQCSRRIHLQNHASSFVFIGVPPCMKFHQTIVAPNRSFVSWLFHMSSSHAPQNSFRSRAIHRKRTNEQR